MARMTASPFACVTTSRPCGIYRPLVAVICLAVFASIAAGREATSTDSASPVMEATGYADTGSSNTDRVPEVTIEARRRALENQVHAFVGKLTHSPRFSGESVPRWGQPLCFAIAGLPKNKGEFVLSRLSGIASSVGAKVRAGRCSLPNANFYVVFSPNPGETLKYLHHHPGLLFHRDATRQEIAKFLSPAKPTVVRVWHNAEFVGRDDAPLGSGSSASCASVPGALVNCDFGASRLTIPAVQDFTRTLVVIDSSRLAGINLGQISDYIAVVGLVDFATDRNLCDAPSILCLFTDASKPPAGLTYWDRAFLRALYNTDRRNSLQRMQIAASMVHDLAQ
jgi:hypothetical protein